MHIFFLLEEKIEKAKSSIESKIDKLPGVINEIKSGVTDFKSSFNSWKSDWTSSRAAKLDKLDETISSRAKEISIDEVKGELATKASQASLEELLKRGGVVKRVQFGYTSPKHIFLPEIEWGDKKYYTQEVHPPFEYNPNKSVLIVNSNPLVPSTAANNEIPSPAVVGYLVNERTINLIFNGKCWDSQKQLKGLVTWQLIEFY